MKLKKKSVSIMIVLLLLIAVIGAVTFFLMKKESDRKAQAKKEKERIAMIEEAYQPFVKVTKDTKLYRESDGKYQEVGMIYQEAELSLKVGSKVTVETEYLPLTTEGYFVSWQDVTKIEALSSKESFAQYIPFPQNVVVKAGTVFQSASKNVFSWYEDLTLPLIVKQDDSYIVKVEDAYYEVASDQVSLVDGEPLKTETASAIATLNYHFFYDDTTEEECGHQSICLSTERFRTHLDYLKEAGFYTMRMVDMERFVKGEVQLPKKSVLITIDDGWLAEQGLALLNEYQMNATVFAITSVYSYEQFASEYIEVHSHGDNLHYTGACPGGQGGPIRCYPAEGILEDLSTTREKLHGTPYFCYPFYEYNDYAISLLEQAGFRMAFVGGSRKVEPGMNLMLLPRYPITSTMTASDIAAMVN